MERFPVGITLLLLGSVVVYLGLAQRALDRMRLSDRGALLVIAAIIIGSFINIPVPFTPFNTSINVGGALVPIGLAIYLLSKAGTAKEWSRALIGAVVTAISVYIIGSLVNSGSTIEPAGRYAVLDAIYLYPLVGGIVAYIFGRSRRAAFVSATLGVLFVDIIHYVWLLGNGAPGNYNVAIGGGGAFDTIILAGIVAILLAELIGESFERLSGGPGVAGRSRKLVQGLQKPQFEVSGEDNGEKHGEAKRGAPSDNRRKVDADKHEGQE
ncbi:DUF1614 domain-containing protein [Pelotomaculum terephthalicicum JT]|uniref:DUF1614 domain-containing protein n=1 Tax=Pelotomaculum TaxID=191373 RepID=UPI0009CA9BD0|nr:MULTISPECIES: DUF1614 domain-containing protein [Pelotomaculum]MCG9967712.1 DUF1614 domain-containing protein [Pelotomaculum terephthalicicum JT]OPX83994.1 MAG: hypothetical protein A4E54_02959 [Pelotomaculum sp. PtaB.Bin117]OPY62933.1 MAG: hypothetical protein A4E56_01000 [Pelotomaculum sp. PtaU1.Bin065]